MLPRHVIRDIVQRHLEQSSLHRTFATSGATPGTPPTDERHQAVATGNYSRPPTTPEQTHIWLGSDHGGFEMKELLKTYLKEQQFNVHDVGTHDEKSVDYPDIAVEVARGIQSGQACRGIVVDGVGIGSCMAANKIHGVRAAHCTNTFEANNCREHNDAHMLCLGGRTIGIELAKKIVDVFLKTPFAGGRHARRIDKINNINKIDTFQRTGKVHS